MPTCAVFWCKNKSSTSNYKKDGVSFHLFPKDYTLKKKWTNSCNRHLSWTPTRTSTICSRHFEETSYVTNTNNRKRLVVQAIPTLRLTSERLTDSMEPSNTNSDMPASQEHESKIEVQLDNEVGAVSILFDVDKNTAEQRTPNTRKTLNQSTNKAEVSPRKIKFLYKIDIQAKKIKRLQSKTRYLKKKVDTLVDIIKDLDRKSLIDKDQKLMLRNIGIRSKEIKDKKRRIKNSIAGKITR